MDKQLAWWMTYVAVLSIRLHPANDRLDYVLREQHPLAPSAIERAKRAANDSMQFWEETCRFKPSPP